MLFKNRGWLLAFIMAVMLASVISQRQIREISQSRLQRLVEKREVSRITIVKNNGGKYRAEITLTPAALEKYSLGANLSSISENPHFVTSIGGSVKEVIQWKEKLPDRDRIDFSSIKEE